MYIKLFAIKTKLSKTGCKIASTITTVEKIVAETHDKHSPVTLEEQQLEKVLKALEGVGNIDILCFELHGYYYDTGNNRIVLYTDFESRIYIPADTEKYTNFEQYLLRASANNATMNYKSLGYYNSVDSHTGRTSIPVVGLLFRWLFN